MSGYKQELQAVCGDFQGMELVECIQVKDSNSKERLRPGTIGKPRQPQSSDASGNRAIQMMENLFSFLESNTGLWLSPALEFLDTVPSSIFIAGVVLLLLHLCYLVLRVFLPTLWKKTDIPKGFSAACPSHREGEPEQQVWSEGLGRGWSCCEVVDVGNVKDPQGQHHDVASLQQLLNPDILCEMVNMSMAEVSQLLPLASLQNVAPTQTPLESTAYVRESSPSKTPSLSSVPPEELLPAPLPKLSPPAPFPLSPNKVTPSADLLSPSPLGDSLPPVPLPPLDSPAPLPPLDSPVPLPPLDSKSPGVPFPPSPPSLPPPTPHHTQKAGTLLPQDATLSVVSSPAGLSTSVPPRGMGHSSTEPPAKNVLTSSLAKDGVKQSFLALHSENLSGGDTAAYLVETSNIWFLPPAVLTCLERQIKKRGDLLMWKEKGKKAESFPKQHKPNYQLFSSGKRSGSIADQHDSALSLPLWSRTGKSEEPQVHPQSPYPESTEDHLQQKYTQLFWGLPTLCPKSLKPTVPSSGDCSSAFVCFNTAPDTSTRPKSPVLPHSPPVLLPASQPQPLPQTLCQYQSQHHSVVHVQAKLRIRSPLPILLSPPKKQFRNCGVCFLGPQNEALTLAPSDIRKLEYNVLQKTQESLWGLPSVVRKSQEEFCPPAPNILLVSQPSKARAPISILLGDFPLAKDVQKKLDHHLRKRRIQHLWGLPRRVYASLSLMRPQGEIPETSESKSSRGLSRMSLAKSQNTKDMNKWGSSQPRSLHYRSSGMVPLEMRVRKGQRNSTKSDQNCHVSSDREETPDNVLGSSLRKDRERYLQCSSGRTSGISMVSPLQKHLENTLKVHLSKKFEEISEGHIPDTVHRSWHSIKFSMPVTEKSTRNMRQKPLAPSRKDSFVNTTQDIFFLGPDKQKMLEDHITLFHKRLAYGLPIRVQESIEIFSDKDSSHFFSHSNFPSCATIISGIESKQSISKTPGGEYDPFHGEQVKTQNSVPILVDPFPDTSTMVKKEQGIVMQPLLDIKHEHVEDLHRVKASKPSLLCQTHSTIGITKPLVAANRCSPKLPTRQAGAGSQQTQKRRSSSYSVEMPQGKRMTWGSSSMSKMSEKSREMLKAQELCASQSPPTSVLTTRMSESSPVSDVQVEMALTPENSPKGTSTGQDPELSDLNSPLSGELMVEMKKREHSQNQGHRSDMTLVSDDLTSKTFLTHDQDTASGNMSVSQVLHVHLDSTQTSMEHGQGPWLPELDLHKGQDKKCPAAAKSMIPLGPKTDELGGGDAGLGTCPPRRRSLHPQDRTFKGALGSRSRSAQSLKEEPAPENLRNQMKSFFQRFYPSINGKGQDGSLEKGSSPSSPVQSRDLVRRRAAFTGNTEDPKIMRDNEKFRAGKHEHRISVIEIPNDSQRIAATKQAIYQEDFAESLVAFPLTLYHPSPTAVVALQI
ncbi:spermatogenesis-associated protein 31D4-like [Sciurus carolinensis]|uniref:spermatogenesis-associated protein 31D4-like n=1 Tax=Sciurus carolinensis TaxID=30640 RepID=UPI001FB30829|nr:spermatogenesis-associated protein 31D4-like [Sciurus carolinensis]